MRMMYHRSILTLTAIAVGGSLIFIPTNNRPFSSLYEESSHQKLSILEASLLQFNDPKSSSLRIDPVNSIVPYSLDDVIESSSNSHKHPRFIFGHSTGHSGSTSIHKALSAEGCHWNVLSKFEIIVEEERYPNLSMIDASKEIDNFDCGVTNDKVLPFLLESIEEGAKAWGVEDISEITYLDMGHFHNRGRILECLADHLKEQVVFVRVRRNRYAIARSFARDNVTPCITSPYNSQLKSNKVTGQRKIHPEITLCPRSDEGIGPVNLPVPDGIWDAMTPFQRFLWYADEMEHRWHTLTSKYNDGQSYHEITWSDTEELKDGIDDLRGKLGCTSAKVQNAKVHLKHVEKSVNCSDLICQDMEYRRVMEYDVDTLSILVSSKFPQHVDMNDCMETGIELKRVIEEEYSLYSSRSAGGAQYDKDTWVLPERS